MAVNLGKSSELFGIGDLPGTFGYARKFSIEVVVLSYLLTANNVPESRDAAGDEYTIGDIVRLLRRRRKIIVNTLAVFLLLVTLRAITATRLYQATGEVEILKESSGDFGLQGSVLGAEAGASDALDYTVTLQTQAAILQSDTLALQVVKEMDLEHSDIYSPKNKTFSLIPGWIYFWRKNYSEPLSVPIEDAPNRRAATLAAFARNLSIKPVSGTRLIDVSYLDRDPKTAAEVVNKLIDAYKTYTFNQRIAPTAQGSGWLTSQLAELKKQTEELQSKAMTLQRQTGMFGDDQEHNIVLSRLQSLNDSLTAAESNRILKEAVYRVAESGNAELISGLSGPTSGSTAPMSSSFTLIQTLRSQEEQARSQLAQDKIKYGPSYPKLISDQAQLDDIERAIKAEVARVEGRAKSDYQIAARTENQARSSFSSQKQQVNDLNDKAIAYQMAKQEADASSALYEGLLSKLKQAGVLEGVKSSNISVVQTASAPPINSPKKPNIKLYYAAGIVAGLFFGIVGAVLVDLSDNSIHSLAEVERTLGVPVLGILPSFGRSANKLLGGGFGIKNRTEPNHKDHLALDSGSVGQAEHAFAHGDMAFAEALRSLRTALMLSRSGSPPQVVLVTSSLPGEGKSTVSLDLAVAFAQQGGRVLLIDADLRTPTLQKRLGVADMRGLSAALSNRDVEPASTTLKQMPNLTLMFGGAVPPFPSELLGSGRMRELLAKWRQEYDYIFIDSPPVLPVTDAIVLSQIADATLLLVQHGATARQAVQRSFRSLNKRIPENAVLGVVVNGVSETSAEYYDYYGYQGYSYTSKAEKDGANG